jgi:hypothetical protein
VTAAGAAWRGRTDERRVRARRVMVAGDMEERVYTIQLRVRFRGYEKVKKITQLNGGEKVTSLEKCE